MMSVDIYPNRKKGYDIVVFNTGEYLNGVAFDFLVSYLLDYMSQEIMSCLYYDDDTVSPCCQYMSIAFQFSAHLPSRAKEELTVLLSDGLDRLRGESSPS